MHTRTMFYTGDQMKAKDTNTEDDTTTNEQHKFVADRFVDHVKTSAGTKYVVRWYGYEVNCDTAEPAENIPQHFNVIICTFSKSPLSNTCVL